MQRTRGAGRRRALAAASAILLLGSCAGDPAGNRGPSPEGAVAHELFTHCGVRALSVGEAMYLPVGGTLGGASSPEGWGDPFQDGWVVVDGATATFTDGAGHRVEFTRAPDDTELPGCM